MSDMATIRVRREVSDRVRDAARAARLTQGQLIEEMLHQRRKAEFWVALEAETPDREYLDELAEADAALLGDGVESVSRFESGRCSSSADCRLRPPTRPARPGRLACGR